ncbi:peptidylprolyl isomerase [Paraliomyxa miuraensis]|uniref:peptidylprolyl isomerase n=1 Tax=Paraliomyxa miuraensis TaxID=376150 RepID=UPI0022562196|nr:peptidylprolyl isomerase [Paraliomyxa miuraensis]MCX4242418.1 peptidylprolyl isomerase [Paraliomyxa miuraensis]
MSETPVEQAADVGEPIADERAAAAEAAEAGGGGLVTMVEQQVEAARRAAPPAVSAVPSAVPPGAELIAVVGGMPIPRSAFDVLYALKEKKYRERGREIPSSAKRRYRKAIVERLVHHERLRQTIATLGEDVDPAAIDARCEQQRLGIEDWVAHLERRGETEATLRAMIEAELRESLILEREGALVVSRADIEKDYAAIESEWVSTKPRVRASHILIPFDESLDRTRAEAKALAEARKLYEQMSAPGADFEALARERSHGPSSRKGGDLGIFTEDRMVAEFSKVAFSLNVGEISKPVKTKFGVHLIKLTGKWPPGPLPIEALQDQIEERLRQRALHSGRRALKDRLERELPATHHLLTPEELAPPSPRGPSVTVDREDLEPEQ